MTPDTRNKQGLRITAGLACKAPMKMKTIGRLLVVAALAIAAAEVGAVCVDAAVRTGIFQEYPFADICDTPPPAGYGPFYISHYGRHGSRYLTREANCLAADVLEHAAGKGALTDAGLELLGRLRRIKAVHSGMYGQLTTRGAEEHRRLAQRMHARFGGVFSNGGKVRCQSSTIPRCLASMANFACELKGLESNLGFDFATGDRYMAAINGLERIRNDTQTAIKKSDRKFMEDTADPALTIGRLFSDESAASRLVGDPYAFMTSLFYMIASCRPLAAELDGLEIFDMFPPEELLALEKAMNGRWYVRMANSAEFGDAVVASAETLAHDIAQRAEEAIRCGGIAADTVAATGPATGCLSPKCSTTTSSCKV